MKGLVLILGESFRTGGQFSRVRGLPESYPEQMKACSTHIKFFEHLKKKYNCDTDVYLVSYTTQFDDDLISVYKDRLINSRFYDTTTPLGLNPLLRTAARETNLRLYDFVLYLRVDLFLKDVFFDIFNPNWDCLRYPFLLWKKDCIIGGKPKNTDMLIFIPRRLFQFIPQLIIGHDSWLMLSMILDDSNIDFMIDTLHDSNSQNDWNPLYYIVNRPQSEEWFSRGMLFKRDMFLAGNPFPKR
jgi:hypothetical protein